MHSGGIGDQTSQVVIAVTVAPPRRSRADIHNALVPRRGVQASRASWGRSAHEASWCCNGFQSRPPTKPAQYGEHTMTPAVLMLHCGSRRGLPARECVAGFAALQFLHFILGRRPF